MGVNWTFPGVFQTRRFHFSMGHGNGIVFDGEILPQLTLPAVNGTLVVSDGVTDLVLPNCRVDEAHLYRSTSGHIIRIRILGPTWHWKLACIDGVYNVRRPDGSVDPTTLKTTQELAVLLLQAMAVPVFDVGGLPNLDGPFVNWHGANAYAELTALCHAYGCDFGLDVWGPVARIWPVGVGSGLPSGGRDVTEDYGIDIAEPPDRIRLYCGPTLYQSKLKLKAVGIDTDGSLKELDDLSYKPAAGWAGVDPSDPLGPDADEEHRRLAKQSYLKYFLIESQSDGTHNVPGYGPVTSVEDILPVYDTLAADYSEDGTYYYQQEAYVEGVFAVKHGDVESIANSLAGERLEIPIRIDRERGLVITSLPIYKWNASNQQVAPELYLVTSYNVRDPAQFHYVYHSQERTIAANGTGTMAVHRADIVRRVIATYAPGGTTPTGTTNNEATLTPQINAHLDAVQAEFQTSESLVKWYIGIMPITLSGSVRQVAFFGSVDQGCYTIAALNTEWEWGMPRRSQRRLAAEADRHRVRQSMTARESRRLARKGVV